MIRIVVGLVLTVLVSCSTIGAAYKWVDDEGIVHYGDAEPADREFQEIEIAPNPSQEQIQRSRKRAEQLITSQKRIERANGSNTNQNDFKRMITHVVAGERYIRKMEEFVGIAVRGDESSLVALVSPNVIRTVGPESVAHKLKNEVIPFFSRYQRLHNVKQINPASGLRGSTVGYWIYTYIVTLTGDVRPFSIVIVEEEGGLFVSDVIVDRCEENRHPFCP